MSQHIDHADALLNWRRAETPSTQGAALVALPRDTVSAYHPDHQRQGWTTLAVGANAGQSVPPELGRMLQANSPVNDADIAGTLEIEADVLVIGAGGAGCAAALTAGRDTSVILTSKLRIGDGNTVMAEGGIQAAIGAEDSLQRHFVDTFNGGHRTADRELVAAMVSDGPGVIQWLLDMGMTFDLDGDHGALDISLKRRRAGGASAARILSFGDATGLELMRIMREAVHLHPQIVVHERSPALELLTDDRGTCVGAVLYDFEHRRLILARASAVILATGGAGRLHLGGFPTSNHYGATADGLALAYRLGAGLADIDSFQYHPTGLAWPDRLVGHLVSEAARSVGATLLNGRADRFVDELAPRDVVSAAILREIDQGRGIARDGAVGVFLDTATLEAQRPGVVESELHTLVGLGRRNGFQPTVEPVLVRPTLHYQNGGVRIDAQANTDVGGLLCAGEVAGGIHGRNRLMGNALLEICAFGRRAGERATVLARRPRPTMVGLDHLHEWRRSLTLAGLPLDITAPVLFPGGVECPPVGLVGP